MTPQQARTLTEHLLQRAAHRHMFIIRDELLLDDGPIPITAHTSLAAVDPASPIMPDLLVTLNLRHHASEALELPGNVDHLDGIYLPRQVVTM